MVTITGAAVDMQVDSGFLNTEDFIVVNSCGYQRYITKDLIIDRPAGRCDYQMIYILNGKCLVKRDGKDHIVEKGGLILFKPGEPQYYAYSHTDMTETYWIHFTGYGAERYLKGLELYDKPWYTVGFSAEYARLYTNIIRELQLSEYASRHLAGALFCELAAQFARAASTADLSRTPDGEIGNTIAEMNLKYHENLPVSYYAARCNLSVYRFIHKFRQATGIPPHEYLTNIRLQMARQLLATSLNIADVTNIIGYSDPLYFSRVFKKRTGMSPSEYKRRTFGFSGGDQEIDKDI